MVSSIQSMTRAIVTCYEDALRVDPELEVRLTVEMELLRDHRLQVTVVEDDIEHTDLARCLTEVLSRLSASFDGVEVGTRWRYPFFFAPPSRSGEEAP